MSKISDRKWSAKEAREDAKGYSGKNPLRPGGGFPKPGERPSPYEASSSSPYPTGASVKKFAESNARAKGVEAAIAKGKQAFAHEQATNKTRQAESVGRKAEAMSTEARRLGPVQKPQASYRPMGPDAGTAHLSAAHLHDMAAKAHDVAAQAHAGVGNMTQSNAHTAAAAEHREKASSHSAEAMSGDWDESKHPRDEAGKFS